MSGAAEDGKAGRAGPGAFTFTDGQPEFLSGGSFPVDGPAPAPGF